MRVTLSGWERKSSIDRGPSHPALAGSKNGAARFRHIPHAKEFFFGFEAAAIDEIIPAKESLLPQRDRLQGVRPPPKTSASGGRGFRLPLW
jgi:hypothetical protein